MRCYFAVLTRHRSRHDYSTRRSTANYPGRIFTILGAVSGVIAIVFIPILFGPIGVILGFVGHAKGDKPLGMYVGIASIVTTIVGMALGAWVWNEMN